MTSHDSAAPADGRAGADPAGIDVSGEVIADPVTDEALAADDGLFDVVPQEGYAGFTLRELIIGGVWLVAFVLSFFPVGRSALGDGLSIWALDGQWLLTIGISTVAVFLLVLRRLSPDGIRRVGSLGIDQFASVAFSVAAASWAVLLWQQIHVITVMGVSFLGAWVTCVELLLSLALVVLTVFAPLVPVIREDFHGRQESLAHRYADPVRPVVARPRPAADAVSAVDADAVDDVADAGIPQRFSFEHAAGGESGVLEIDGLDDSYIPAYARGSSIAPAEAAGEPIVAQSDSTEITGREITGTEVADGEDDDRIEPQDEAASEEHVDESEDVDEPEDVDGFEAPEPVPAVSGVAEAHPDALTEVFGDIAVDENAVQEARPADAGQPFWALAPEIRPVHDEKGEVIYEIGPDAWTLVLEDRDGAYVVRHDDGRIGYLHDTTNMTRG
ncbi:hypothetical protein GCM10025768_19730 [Microbacterium pseudoresistens]|uniref:Uncharacterized protein n=1 Tax=Microbacterium pseudoresistens TaxID=640634 RepID=A0A7Y9EXD4_9MICO|nr:hypothetical protein [Microbacterium pseudoresistens]NYD55667.1 hypothetical protein [Microbacterium pseudoresistens]